MLEEKKQNLHLLLIWNSNGVTGNQSSHLLWPKTIKLITLEHLKSLNQAGTNQSTQLYKRITWYLCKMSLYVRVSIREKIQAAMEVSKCSVTHGQC